MSSNPNLEDTHWTLLSHNDSEKRSNAANIIVMLCDDRITTSMVELVNNKIMINIEYPITSIQIMIDSLIRTNICMFIALIMSLDDDTLDIEKLTSLVYAYGILQKRSRNTYSIEPFKILLDHCEFDTSDLQLPRYLEKKIQKYRYQKYSGKSIKSAISRN